jgi:hypothetical protein
MAPLLSCEQSIKQIFSTAEKALADLVPWEKK